MKIAEPDISMSVEERLSYKARNEIFKLDHEEREALEDMILDGVGEEIRRATDERLINMAEDYGCIV